MSHVRMRHVKRVKYDTLTHTNLQKWWHILVDVSTFKIVQCHAYERVMPHTCMSHIWTGHVTHVYESCHTYQQVVSRICTSHDAVNESTNHITHMNESWHIEWVMARINESWHVWMSLQIISHIWMSHGTLNESWHEWMSHGTYEWVYKSYHTYESVMAYRMSHGTYEWVITHMNESWHVRMSHVTYEWVMTRTHEYMYEFFHDNATSFSSETTIFCFVFGISNKKLILVHDYIYSFISLFIHSSIYESLSRQCN